jgi:hypothetical protein
MLSCLSVRRGEGFLAFRRLFLVSGHNTPSATLPSPDHCLRLGGCDLTDEPLDVVSGGGHRALPISFPQTAIPQVKTHPALEFREGMLHPATDRAQFPVALLLLRRERMPSRRPLDDAVEFPFLPELFLLLLVDVRAVIEDSCFVSVEHLVLMDRVMILGGGGEHFLDEFPLRVGGNVHLVPVVAAMALLRKRSLRIAGGGAVFSLPSLGNFADRGIDALAVRDGDAPFPELSFHFHKERLVPLLLDEGLPKPTDRCLIGNVRIGGDPEKLLVRGTIMDVLLRLGIGKAEELLEENHAEQHGCIEWPPAAFGRMELCMPLLRE